MLNMFFFKFLVSLVATLMLEVILCQTLSFIYLKKSQHVGNELKIKFGDFSKCSSGYRSLRPQFFQVCPSHIMCTMITQSSWSEAGAELLRATFYVYAIMLQFCVVIKLLNNIFFFYSCSRWIWRRGSSLSQTLSFYLKWRVGGNGGL